jgi:hypothetical protein
MFRNTSHRPTSGTCSINLLQRVRDNQSEGIRPCFIDDYLDRHGASGEIEGTLGRLEHRLA